MGAIIIMRRSALSEGRTAWYRRSVCRRERPSRPLGPGSSVTGTVTYLLWRLWLGCELSLRAPTSSGSNPDLRDGSGARGVNLVPKARQAGLLGRAQLVGVSIFPPALESGWGQFGIADCVLDVL